MVTAAAQNISSYLTQMQSNESSNNDTFSCSIHKSTQKTGQVPPLLQVALLFSDQRAHKVSGQSGFVLSVGRKTNRWELARSPAVRLNGEKQGGTLVINSKQHKGQGPQSPHSVLFHDCKIKSKCTDSYRY